MRKILWPWWTVLVWMAVWIASVLVVSIAQASCVKGRAHAAKSEDDTQSSTDKAGFHVISMHWDPVLRRRWALVGVCDHPDWPAVVMPMSDLRGEFSTTQSQEVRRAVLRAEPVVRAGDAVQLWSRQGDLRIEAAAIAEQNGGLGQVVRVRLMQRKTLGQQVEEEFSGVVRGPRDVEMQP